MKAASTIQTGNPPAYARTALARPTRPMSTGVSVPTASGSPGDAYRGHWLWKEKGLLQVAATHVNKYASNLKKVQGIASTSRARGALVAQ